MPGFAERLTASLGLPFRPVVVKTCETEPQASWRTRTSSSGTCGARSPFDGVPPGESALLVDVRVDSRWALTVVAAALLEAGSGPVSPFVLGKAVSD